MLLSGRISRISRTGSRKNLADLVHKWRYPLKCVIALALYAAVIFYPSELMVEGQEVSFFWPASGIAIAIAARFGVLPLAVVFFLNWAALYRVVGVPSAAAVAALGLVLEAMLGAWFFIRVLKGSTRISRRGDLLKFLGACVLVAPVVGASIGAASWCAFGIVAWERAQTAWLCWWYGESIGILFSGAALLGGFTALWRSLRVRATEAATVGLCVIAVSIAVFYASPDIPAILRAPLAVLPLPFLYWSATRVGSAYTSVLLTLFGGILVAGTRAGYGPFGEVHTATALVWLWAYGHLCGITSLIMGTLLSERDEAVEALRLSEARYRDLVETGPSVVYSFHHDDVEKITYISPQVEALLGHTPEACCAERGFITRMIHPEDLLEVAEKTAHAWRTRGRMRLEYRIVRADGAIRWVRDEATFSPEHAGAPAFWQGVLVDVTEHREIAEAHRKTQELLSGIWASSTGAIFVIDTEGHVIMANPAAQEMMGFATDEVTGMKHNDPRFHGETVDGKRLTDEEYPFSVVMRTGKPIAGYIVAICDDNGHRKLLSIDGAPLRDAEGALAGAYFLANDITARHDAELRLKESEARLAAIISSATDVMVSVDESLRITMFNPAAEKAFGYRADEVLGKPLGMLLPERFVESHARALRAYANDEYPSDAQRPVGACMYGLRANGEEFPTEASFSKTEIGGKKILTAILRDISERLREEEQRRSLEAQLRQAQKIEAVGQLAGGVAHDFNNLLQVVQGFTRLAMEPGVNEEQRAQYLKSVCEAADKAAALTTQLLAFGRRQSLEKADCDLTLLVQDHLKMIRRLIGEHIQIEFTPGHSLGNVRVDRSQVEQVLLNLCLNARDAMPGGGMLHIELGNVLIDSSYRATHPWAREGRYVLLTVTDTGSGMTAETQARIFEPFFTTKPLGQGTGLGLSVVYGIIQQHEGLVQVYSEPGVGTTFKVYFPTVERLASTIGVSLEPVAPRGNGTVLLAEDEAGVRDIAMKLLERAGYDVIAAENGEEAVALFRRHSNRISLLIFDVVMPRMGGFQAYEEIAKTHPHLPTLFCSGYSGATLNHNGDIPHGTHFLHKPYSYEQLLRKLAEVNEGGATP